VSNDKSHSVLGQGSFAQGHCVPLGRVWKLPSNIHFWFTFAQRFSRYSHQYCRLLPQRLHHDSLSCLVIEATMTATGERGGATNGWRENIATKKIGYAAADTNGPRGRRCRHAEFLPYPANNAAFLTELDPNLSTIHKLSFRRHPSQLSNHHHPRYSPTPPVIVCTAPEAAQVIAYCILRACLGHASSTANFRRQLPSRAPSYFPFEIERPSTPFPTRAYTYRICS
jgi:hypothetical protein